MIVLPLLALVSAAAVSPAAPAGVDPRLTPAPGTRIDSDFLIGTWSDQRDCSAPIVFRPDGDFVMEDGARGTWRLDGDRLIMTGRRSVTVRLVPHSRDEVSVVNEDASIGYSRRCPDASDPSKNP